MPTAIRETKNYEIFELHEVNRNVNTQSIGFISLLSSMERHGFISAYPLHCVKGRNGKLKIKAGHHRFEAAKRLGLPVKYVLTNDMSDIIELERAGAGRWSGMDYFTSFCKQGIPDYLEIRDYMEATGIRL